MIQKKCNKLKAVKHGEKMRGIFASSKQKIAANRVSSTASKIVGALYLR